ncbi:hypothetical protein R3P38DRAFT_3169338 [Favolaschia claudopus]|uniref:Uncharacterized protein n=1 Tax=Favolaschia claudopus TaxID=2862362 RepID=A0AAW0DY73_9AGAR
MPRLSARQARAREVIKTFLDHHKARIKRALRRKLNLTRTSAQAGFTPQDMEELAGPALLLAPDTVSIAMSSGSESETDTDTSS